MSAVTLNFPHRRNLDGVYESICATCFATVGKSENEAELLTCERAHIGDPMQLFYTREARVRDTPVSGGAALPFTGDADMLRKTDARRS
jgi:hypothetical protein